MAAYIAEAEYEAETRREQELQMEHELAKQERQLRIDQWNYHPPNPEDVEEFLKWHESMERPE